MSRLPDAYDANLSRIAERIRERGRTAFSEIIAIGSDLIKAKDMLPHGQFLPWVQKEFAWGERTARRFMSVAELANRSGVSDLPELPVSALYTIASARAPEKVIACRPRQGRREGNRQDNPGTRRAATRSYLRGHRTAAGGHRCRAS
jgi:hypothetical protein